MNSIRNFNNKAEIIGKVAIDGRGMLPASVKRQSTT